MRSINLFVKDAVIYIFDNSDKFPFTAKFDNVTIFDNTKGSIIDFNKWLEGYPNRTKSSGRANKWGSAKHCYSVEKAISLIDDNLVLLDSDVLLKRDISNLFNNDKIFIGEVLNQPNSSIKRVLPFVCYINVKMCKENGIHYFDDDYMHGLCKGGNSDKYDTGSGFYLHTSKYPHVEIKTENYAVHYRHGSWNKEGDKPTFTQEQWLNIHKRYWSNERNKKVVYTCISGNYDTLKDPKYYSDGFDYICFTDNKDFKSEIWDIKPLPKETDELPQVKKQRYVKINPHLLLKEYDLSIWVDGNVTLRGDLNEFVKESLKKDCSVYVPKHPQRNCIYAETAVVLKMKKDKSDVTKPQMDRYKKEGFPQKYGLLQSNILLRKHNDKGCIKLMECWFNELKNGSHRDQLSFNYASWKNEDVKVVYLDKNIYKSKYFFWNGSHLRPSGTSSTETKTITKVLTSIKKPTKNSDTEQSLVNSKRIETQDIALY